MSGSESLFERLGGYSGIAGFVDDLLPRLQQDEDLGRFWAHRGADGVAREKQLLIDFICASAGGPVYYTGRDMKLSHVGMRISEDDWERFLMHATATLQALSVPERESREVAEFVLSLKADIVEA